MSFKAVFELGGKKYNVLHASYSFSQDVDATGRPSSIVKGGSIQLSIESTSDSAVAEWMVDAFKKQDGKITFYKRDSEQKMKELSFKEGYVVNQGETFTNTGDNPMAESFTIAAKEIKVGNAEHKNEWPE